MLYKQVSLKRKNHKPNATVLAALVVFQITTTQAMATQAVSAKPTVPAINQQQVINAALNKIEYINKTIVVKNRAHRAEFNSQGVVFKPDHGPVWHWQLHDQTDTLMKTLIQPVVSNNAVDYIHQNYTERYLLKTNSIEQRFIIERPYQKKHDLVIEGKISSKGKFETTANGWLWRDKQGVVSLGQVTVFDATGKTLPATMHTEANFSRITVAASDLKAAAYPVTIDPEIGSNDFGISSMGASGDIAIDALTPAVSYNSTNDEYLVVWSGEDDTIGALVDNEFEIYGQRYNATTGAEIGSNDFRISDMGPDGDNSFDATTPAVSYNATDNEYLVVWRADNDTGGVVDGKFEIYGQRINAATGAEIGSNDFRISAMGLPGNSDFDANDPAISYNITNNEYLVVWSGDNNTGLVGAGEFEIYGQRIDAANGGPAGGFEFRISDSGPDGDINFDTSSPAVAFNVTNNEYLVVWKGPEEEVALATDSEIYGQRINAATGAEVGDNDFRISDMGQVDGVDFFAAYSPAISYNAIDNEYLVVWEGDDDTGSLVGNEREIYGQLINAATGAEIGDNDFRISDMGPDGDFNFDAKLPAVNFNAINNEYFVAWLGDDNIATADGDNEIFAQRIASTGAEIGDNDFRLSDMGPIGDPNFDADDPAVSYSDMNGTYLVVWAGDDSPDGKSEIFGQKFASPSTLGFTNTTLTVAEDAGSVQIEVQRTTSSNTATIDFATTNGSAIAPGDYTTANGTLTFNVGENSQFFTIDISDNNASDGDRTINLNLSNAQVDVDVIELGSATNRAGVCNSSTNNC